MKAGYHISIVSILGIASFLCNEKFTNNTKHGTLIVVTFNYIVFILLKIDSPN